MEITSQTGSKTALLKATVQDSYPFVRSCFLGGIVADNDCVNKDAESPDIDMF